MKENSIVDQVVGKTKIYKPAPILKPEDFKCVE
jgi:hypothetical protein